MPTRHVAGELFDSLINREANHVIVRSAGVCNFTVA
jgi:hypothetical protein